MSHKYFTLYKISLGNLFTYRFNFFLGRLRNIIVMVILYILWTELTKTGTFFSYSREDLITYVLGIHILRSLIIGPQARKLAEEINDGSLSSYLIKPINYLRFVYTKELAERLTLFMLSCFEAVVFILLVQPQIRIPHEATTLFLFVVSVFLSHFLYIFLSFLMSSVAFWSREALGPRFLFDWILEFASGGYFPLNIVSYPISLFLQFLPFAALFYTPMIIFLEKGNTMLLFGLQIFWLIVALLVLPFIWKKGLKKYSGEGI